MTAFLDAAEASKRASMLVDVPAHAIPPSTLDALRRVLHLLDDAVSALTSASTPFARELALLSAIRRKSHAQHKNSRQFAALSILTRRARDFTRIGALEKMQRLRADVEATMSTLETRYSSSHGGGRMLDENDVVVFPSRRDAETAAAAAYAWCALARECGDASVRCVMTSSGEVGRGYFMPLGVCVSAGGSRVARESGSVVEACVRAYNAAAEARGALPPDGVERCVNAPAEVKVVYDASGIAYVEAIGDARMMVDADIDAKSMWRAFTAARRRPAADDQTMTRVEEEAYNEDDGLDGLSDLGVRVDRTGMPPPSTTTTTSATIDGSRVNVVRVMKASQVPAPATKKYTPVVPRSAVLGGVPTRNSAPNASNAAFIPSTLSSSSKKRQRKREKDALKKSKAAKREKIEVATPPGFASEDALERLKRLSAFGSFESK